MNNKNDANKFYATFVPGLQKIIPDVLKERLSDVTIHKLLDGAVLFETQISYDKLNFFCFNNIFAVIDVIESSNDRYEYLLENHILNIAQKAGLSLDILKKNNKSFKTFRIVFSRENVLAAINEKLRIEIEKHIARLSGLTVNRSKPDAEFWFLYRRVSEDKNSGRKGRNDFSVFMKRLTFHSSWDKTLHKGELPPTLAWSLCRLAHPVHSDTILDPFCGYGSIPEAALKHFHFSKFIACDNNNEAAGFIKSRFKNRVSAIKTADTHAIDGIKTSSSSRKENNFDFYQNDFSELPSLLGDKSVDVIITDPPWGRFSRIDKSIFYPKMFRVFNILLRDGGRAVILYVHNEDFLRASIENFTIIDSISILLSGKKTNIYQLVKN